MDNSWVEKWCTLTWFRNELKNFEDIKTEPADHDHVAEMMRQGYTSGELIKDREGKETVRGWWEKKK